MEFPIGIVRYWRAGSALVRRRVLWLDWQRKRKPRMVLLRSENGTGWRGRTSFSCSYKSPLPGLYTVRLPTPIAADISSQPDKWEAQFGRRRIDVKFSTGCGPGSEDWADCVLTLDLEGSRTGRLSPDGIYGLSGEQSEDSTRALYAEVASAWRQLTDVRFKLLALLPIASGIGYLQLLSPTSAVSSAPKWTRMSFAVFAVIVTAALFAYERRNSELYDDLISRGKHLEHAMGASSGVFLGRLGGRWPIRHDVALIVIYWSMILGWIVVLIAVVSGAGDLGDENQASIPTDIQTTTTTD